MCVHTAAGRDRNLICSPLASWPSGNPGPTEEMSQEKGLPCLSSSCGMHLAPGPRWHTLSGGDTLTVGRQNSVLLKAWSLRCPLFYSRISTARMGKLRKQGRKSPTETGVHESPWESSPSGLVQPQTPMLILPM